MTPALIVVWVLGLTLAWLGGWYDAGWFHVKMALVLGLTAVHGGNIRFARDFAKERNQRSARFFRYWNELPTLFLLAIVILAVVKPF
jgi:putative membrane protein